MGRYNISRRKSTLGMEKMQPSGQYFYSIEIIDYKNKKEKEVGRVTLLK